MILRNFFGKKDNEESNYFWISFADMMSGLLIVFILICMALMIKALGVFNHAKNQLKEAQLHVTGVYENNKSLVNDILKEFKNKLESDKEIRDTLLIKKIEIKIDENTGSLSIPAELFNFEKDSYIIAYKYHSIVDTIGNILYSILVKKCNKLESVFIEGHTDTDRYKNSPDDKENWTLSTNRAIEVYKFWCKTYNFEKLLNAKNKSLVSVSGYGPTRPIETIDNYKNIYNKFSNDDREIKKIVDDKNRRIDIRIIANANIDEIMEEMKNSFSNIGLKQ